MHFYKLRLLWIPQTLNINLTGVGDTFNVFRYDAVRVDFGTPNRRADAYYPKRGGGSGGPKIISPPPNKKSRHVFMILGSYT